MDEIIYKPMTLTQYADYRGITIQAVAASFRRHMDEMQEIGGMFRKEGRTTVLLPDGVKYMDDLRKKLPVEPVDDIQTQKMKAMELRILQLQEQLHNAELNHAAEVKQLDDTIRMKDERIDQLNTEVKAGLQQMVELTQSQNTLLIEMQRQHDRSFFEKIRDAFRKG